MPFLGEDGFGRLRLCLIHGRDLRQVQGIGIAELRQQGGVIPVHELGLVDDGGGEVVSILLIVGVQHRHPHLGAVLLKVGHLLDGDVVFVEIVGVLYAVLIGGTTI